MSTSVTITPAVAQNATQAPRRTTPKTVYVRLRFLRIGEIDTLNEKYQAQAAVESRWNVQLEQLVGELSSDDQARLNDGKSVSLLKYAESHWHPQIYIENALGDLKEQIRYSAKVSKEDGNVYVYEHRDIKGLFWEKLELQHFPSDVQDLSISVTSMFCNDRVILLPDPHALSGVNRAAFVDQQEWKLYAHVDAVQGFADEFNYHADNMEELEVTDIDEDRKRTVVTVTCHAARRSSYFYWNGYCLIFLITAVSYACYFVPPHLLMSRLQTTCTLLLTSITFRWTVNKSLPTISYLTSMDAYAIVCIFSLVLNGLWHTFMGALIYETVPGFTSSPRMWQARLDRMAFMVSFSLFVIGHICFVTWIFAVPLNVRRKMKQKDAELLAGKSNQHRSEKDAANNEPSSKYERIPVA